MTSDDPLEQAGSAPAGAERFDDTSGAELGSGADLGDPGRADAEDAVEAAGPDAGDPVGQQVATLPPRVRRALIDFAAQVLGTMPEAEIPIGLRKIRSFTPARRSRAGAAPLTQALDSDRDFRLRVAIAWRARYPELAAALDADEPAPTLDPVLPLVGVYLCRPEGWERQLNRRLALIAADEQASARREAVGAEREEIATLRTALARAGEQVAAAEAAQAELAEELAKLRREQRRLRADADRARSATREAVRQATEEQDRLTAALAERDELVRRAERQAQETQEQLAATRRSARDGKSLAEIRTRLLLDTIVESASALRRELALPPAAQTPAELVAEQLISTEPAAAIIPARGRAAEDPEFLAEVLRLPRAHLLVDGYNVSIEGFGSLPLVDQRRLLVDGLASLAVRTSAEITCCFDGAEVEVRPNTLVRGVRVLFSDPGTTADDLIGRLVRAEPAGRVLVVVSSDGEVIASAVAAGARSFRSTVLLRLLGSGLKDRQR